MTVSSRQLSTAELRSRLVQRRSEFDQRVGQARALASQLNEVRREAEALTERVEYLDQISGLLASYADEQQAKVQGSIETVVSTGLHTIFGEDLRLRIENRMVGRRPEIDFKLVSETGGELLETSVLDARGGGVAAVAGFLIRAVMVMLTPGVRPVLFLDESFANVSAEYQPALASWIAELTERSPVQIILVTHAEALTEGADKIYRFEQVDGITQVRPC